MTSAVVTLNLIFLIWEATENGGGQKENQENRFNWPAGCQFLFC